MARAVEGPAEVLVDAATIQGEVARLAAAISRDYADKRLHLVGVLKSSTIFVADLMRALSIPLTVDFISVVPYGQVTASGVVRIRKDLDDPIEGRDVLVVEAVCASGRTLSYLLSNFQIRNPASLKVCALLVKQRDGMRSVRPEYVGCEIPDVYVVGYGLDRDEQYRNLPHIARLAS
jgi:hypoxanthine phosphoribosyltransferase